ncbi:DMT family transporter [Roseovarius indicus]|uniref:DMT family transporter n=1 Tax=Roseovarius indicus TaxID=540747 RepID=UPI0007DA0762|nr:DMT family transporter [Roseovarius indicus]OAO05379.1 hypothetical protein A8B76_02750 [Roseovarius indicus]
MTGIARLQNPSAGIGFILLAIVALSANDVLIKFLSGGYPLHQMVFCRSAIGILFSIVLLQLEGGWKLLRTSTPGLHALRCLMIIFANMTYFAALAVLPLAEATAAFFVAPLMITLLSIPLLGEKVGPLRIGAVVVGLLGVIIMTRPWQSDASRDVSLWVYLLPIIAAFAYALNQVLTRKLGVSSKASAMAIYIQVGFIIVSSMFWLVAGDGRFAEGVENESLVFLLRAWVWPEGTDIYLFLALGFSSSIVGYCLSAAYRIADAATIAPFEYTGLPLAILWGWLIWDDLPGPVAMMGIALILGAGLFVFLRERQKKRYIVTRKRLHRRF